MNNADAATIREWEAAIADRLARAEDATRTADTMFALQAAHAAEVRARQALRDVRELAARYGVEVRA